MKELGGEPTLPTEPQVFEEEEKKEKTLREKYDGLFIGLRGVMFARKKEGIEEFEKFKDLSVEEKESYIKEKLEKLRERYPLIVKTTEEEMEEIQEEKAKEEIKE